MMREAVGNRWRVKSDGSEERWKAKDDEDGTRWTRRGDDERPPRGGGGGGAQRRAISRDRSPRRHSRDRGGAGGAGDGGRRNYRYDRMLYMANIPYEVRWMELKDLIREKAGEVNFVEILEERNGKSKGAAVIEFREKESVQRCIDNLHRFPMNDRLLSVKEIRDPVAFFRKIKEDTGVDFLNGHHGGSQFEDRPRPEDTFETYGLSPAFLRQLSIVGPLTNRVFVSNLPYNVQSGRVYEIFSLAGKVTLVDLQLDKDGRSKGMAVVQFTHPIESVQAISMLNNQKVFDRVINVRMDRFDTEEKREGELPLGLRSVGMGLGANGAPLGDVSSIISSLTSGNSFGNAPLDSASSQFPNSLTSGFQSSSGSFSSNLPFPTANSYAVGGSGGGGAAAGIGGISFPTASSTYGSASTFGSVPSTYSAPRSILIKNLPVDYTWQIVRDRVQQFGPVDMTEMIAPGCAKVTFAASTDAERARKSLQNTTVEGRLIGVEFLA